MEKLDSLVATRTRSHASRAAARPRRTAAARPRRTAAGGSAGAAIGVALVALAGALFGAVAPASALTSFCSGAGCDVLATTDRGDGTAFDFVLGLDAEAGDRRIDIKTRGHVYLVGPIPDDSRVQLAASSILLEGPITTNRRLKLKTRDLVPGFVPDPTPSAPAPGGRADRTRLREGRGGAKIKSNGDIYLDLSGVDLDRLRIKARGTIVVDDTSLSPSVPVPEPTTVLLMGLGLGGLSLRRVRQGAR